MSTKYSSLINYAPFESALKFNFKRLLSSKTFESFIFKYDLNAATILMTIYDVLEYKLLNCYNLDIDYIDDYNIIRALYNNSQRDSIRNNLFYDALERTSYFN